MRLSKKGEYALKALMYLTEKYGEGVEPIEAIAENGNIPRSFLEQILLVLKNAGVLESRRGNEGGYRLKRPPDQVTLGEVIRIIDGPLAPFNDRAGLERLIHTEERHRGLYRILLDVRNAVSGIMDTATLSDLCRRTMDNQDDVDVE